MNLEITEAIIKSQINDLNPFVFEFQLFCFLIENILTFKFLFLSLILSLSIFNLTIVIS